MRITHTHMIKRGMYNRVLSSLVLAVFLSNSLMSSGYADTCRETLAPNSYFKDASKIKDLQDAQEGLRAKRKSERPALLFDDLLAGTSLGEELQNMNRGRQLFRVEVSGDATRVKQGITDALKDVSPEQVVYLSCRVRTTERNIEDDALPPHALVRHAVVVAKAKSVKERVNDVIEGRLKLLQPYLAVNIGEYREDRNLHIYWIGLAEAFRGKGHMSAFFDRLTDILRTRYGGYSYTSNMISEAMEHLHASRGLEPVDISSVTDPGERENARRLVARVQEYEFVGDGSAVVYGRIPRQVISAEESERRALLTGEARRFGLAVDIGDRTIQGQTILEWARGHKILLDGASGVQSRLLYESSEKVQYHRYRGDLAEIEAYIMGYARSIGEEEKTRKWMDDLKASARRFGRDQKEYITGLDGPHKLKKTPSPLEWAARGNYERELAKARQEKLFGSYPVEGARVEDLPLWPVDENGRVIEKLTAWMSVPGEVPPPRYFMAKKVALKDIAPVQLTLDFGEPAAAAPALTGDKTGKERVTARFAGLAEKHEKFYDAVITILMDRRIDAGEKEKRMDTAFDALVESVGEGARRKLYRRKYDEFKGVLSAKAALLKQYPNDGERKAALLVSAADKIGYAAGEDLRMFGAASAYFELYPGLPVIEMERPVFLEFVSRQDRFKGAGAVTFLPDPGKPPFILMMQASGERQEKVLQMKTEHELQHLLYYFIHEYDLARMGTAEKEETEEAVAFSRFKNEVCSYILGFEISPLGMVPSRSLAYTDNPVILGDAARARDFIDLCIKCAGIAGISPRRFLYPVLRARNFNDIKTKCFSLVPVPREASEALSKVFKDFTLDKAKAYMFSGDKNIIEYLPETIKAFVGMLQQVYTNDQLRSLYEGVSNRTYEFRAMSDLRKGIVGSQIGKRAVVESVSGGSARVRNHAGIEIEVPLNMTGPLNVPELRKQLGGLSDPAQGEVLERVLGVLEKSPPDRYAFGVLVDDLFGFAPSPNMIALHDTIAQKPIAVFHEACEALLQSGDLRLTLDKGRLTVVLPGGSPLSVTLSKAAFAIAGKDPANKHYLLRALTREVFGGQDARLTQFIKTIQRIHVLEDKAVQGDAACIRSLREIAVHPDSDPEAARAALRAVENVIATEDLGTMIYADCAGAVRMVLSAKPSLIGPSTAAALETILRRDLGLYAHEESAVVCREIALSRPWLVQPSLIEALITMLREKGFQTFNASPAILYALKDIVDRRPDFITPELIGIVNGVFVVEGLRTDMYGTAVAFMRVAANNKPELIEKNTIENIEGTIKTRTMTLEGYREAALFMRAIDQKLPKHAQAARRIIEKFLKKEGANPQILQAVKRAFYNGDISHIGKVGRVADISEEGGKRYAHIVDRYTQADRLGTVELVPQDDARGRIEGALLSLADDARPQSRVMEDFLKLLRTSPLLQDLRFSTYTPFIADVFGFASREDGLIALYAPFGDDPVALFHEFGEYLIAAGMLDLELDGDALQISFRSNPAEPFEIASTMLINHDTRSFIESREAWDARGEANWRKDDHYLLRVLQRQLFGSKDRNLTSKIQHLQDIERLQALACDGDLSAVNRLISLAYNLKAEYIVSRKALEALEQVLLTDGLSDPTYAEAASGIRVVAINQLRTVTGATVRAMEKCLRASTRSGFLAAEVAAGLREIAYAYPELMQGATVDALTYLLNTDGLAPDEYLVCSSLAMYISRGRPELITPALFGALAKRFRQAGAVRPADIGVFLSNISQNCARLETQLAGDDLRLFLWFSAGLPYVPTFYDEYMRAADPRTYRDALAAQNEKHIDVEGLANMIDDFVLDQDKKYSNLTVILGCPYSREIRDALESLNKDLKRACPEGILQAVKPEAFHTTVAGAGRIVKEFIPEGTFERTKEGLAPVIEGRGAVEGSLRGELRLSPNGVVILEVNDPDVIEQVERIRDAVTAQEPYRHWYRPKIVHITVARLKTADVTPEQVMKIRDVLNRWNQSGPFVKGLPVSLDKAQFGLFSPNADRQYYATDIRLQPAGMPCQPLMDTINREAQILDVAA